MRATAAAGAILRCPLPDPECTLGRMPHCNIPRASLEGPSGLDGQRLDHARSGGGGEARGEAERRR
eukprot:2790605-Pyramimonas_sp.AAC.1